jgi:hypothetical protein
VRDLAISWCCDYLNALSKGGKVYYYEELLRDINILLYDVAALEGVDISYDVDINIKSSTYLDSTGSTDFEKKYKKHLSEDQIIQIQEVLEHFEIDYPF